MNLVVNFLSMLVAEEENGGVKRMLGVCSEFERIAKVVLDKADKDSSTRRKRKNNEEGGGKAKVQQMSGPNSMTPVMGGAPQMFGVFSPGSMLNPNQNGFSPPGANPNNSPGMYSNQDYNGDYATPRQGMTPYAEIQQYSNNGGAGEMQSPLMGGGMGGMTQQQQPFVPQDLWQMPMSLDWDWADMTGGAYPSFENGIVGENTAAQMMGNMGMMGGDFSGGQQGPGMGRGM